MKRSLTSLLFSLSLGICAADVPDGMTYQGVLTDNSGNPVADATPANQDIEFRIYSQPSGGTPLWGEKQTVTVFKGNFSVVLGNGVALGGGIPSGKPSLADVFADGTGTTFFFGITPDGAAEFVPRQGILANAFAFRAKVAESVNGDFLKTASGRLGLGVPVPQATLHTNGRIFVEESVTGAPATGRTGGNGTKLVLWPGTTTNHPYAFGINSSTLWSGVPSGAQHKWYVGGTQEMSLNSLGLAVGNQTPRAEFHVKGRGWFEGGVDGGLGSLAGKGVVVKYTNSADYGQIFAYDYSATTSKNLMLQRPGGRVGIGAFNTPDANLHVYGATDPTIKIQSNGTNEISGRLALRQSNNTGCDIYYDGTGNEGLTFEMFNGGSAFGKAMFIKQSNGNVGIGTINPNKGKLEIAGSVNYTAPGGFSSLIQTSGILPLIAPPLGGPIAGTRTPFTSGSRSYSLWASNSVGAFEFNAHSDERIKKVQGVSDGADDLDTLNKIEVTDYTLKDVVTRGDSPKKKVIAQQVEKVYPQAVAQTTNVVPDIYKLANLKDGWIELETDLKKGERVRLIVGDNQDGIYEVTEVGRKRFRTSYELPKEMKRLFVFGREVDDFRSVDYEAISMLNVSATQEIYRKVTTLEARVAELEAKDKARDAKLAEFEKLLRSVTDAKPAGE